MLSAISKKEKLPSPSSEQHPIGLSNKQNKKKTSREERREKRFYKRSLGAAALGPPRGSCPAPPVHRAPPTGCARGCTATVGAGQDSTARNGPSPPSCPAPPACPRGTTAPRSPSAPAAALAPPPPGARLLWPRHVGFLLFLHGRAAAGHSPHL